MSPNVDCDTFLDAVLDYGLLTEPQVAPFRDSPDTAAEVARRMVRDRLLTPFQAGRS